VVALMPVCDLLNWSTTFSNAVFSAPR